MLLLDLDIEIKLSKEQDIAVQSGKYFVTLRVISVFKGLKTLCSMYSLHVFLFSWYTADYLKIIYHLRPQECSSHWCYESKEQVIVFIPS